MTKLMLTLAGAVLMMTTAQAESLTLTTPKGVSVSVTFFTPRTVHITKTPKGKSVNRKSMVVVAQPQDVAVRRGESGSELTLSSQELTVRVNKTTGRVAFEGLRLKNLLSEQDYSFEERTSGSDRGACRVSTTFRLQKDEPVYGLGTLQDGLLSHRGKHVVMEQSNLEDFQLVLQSIRGWAIYWDNYSRTTFDSPKGGTTMSLSSEVGDAVDYYLMLGGSADGNVREMRALSGQVPMFPLWTYGYWQSKERYKTSRELLDVVKRYRQEQVPLDGIIQDWQYWGSNYLWNAMDFLSEDFSNGKQMIDNVHKKHAHFMISIWASFGPMTQQFRELEKIGCLLPFETWPQSGISHVWPPMRDYPSGVKVYDAFHPEARNIYWKYLKKLYDYGCDAWWMDSTDPDFFNPRESDYEHKVYGGTWRSQRNAFPLETVRGIYQSQRKDDRGKRIFIMTRSSYAGQQHYGSNMWSGDVNSSWDMLRKQVPAGLSFTLTGNPNFNTDIGGFFCSSYNTKGSGSAPKNPQFQELYVRWMQYGLFCPVFRSHGADAPREIWQFGKKGEPVYDAIEKQIRLRYRLIPYLYSTAWQVTSNNDSYMRPLFAEFAADKKVWNMTDEFMFGHNILACPIVDPQYTEEKVIRTNAMTGWDRNDVRGQKEEGRSVDWTAKKSAVKYLPKGTVWYDFWTNQSFKGGQNVTLVTQFDRVPMFVRAGSILPLGPEMQYVGEKAWDNLEIRVYPGANASFTLYEDEGDNYNYEKGVYSTITFSWNDKARKLTIGARKGEFPGMLKSRQFTIILPDGRQQQVSYDGAECIISL